ncbi:sensor histidine kinase [Thermotomaculum hydrothermale]|uniref:sensor histidine kinase n=1 Tax=Thermotomaculum hydrothermale TaxID=981385 RepID=UPI0019168191|nr:HAMP domain-containing sensor histidine kinase [Thermotomaculum hydrothermale]
MKNKFGAGVKKKISSAMILLTNIGLFVVLAYLVFYERNAYFSLRREAGKALMTSVSHNLEYSLRSEKKLKEQLRGNLLSLASYFSEEAVKNGKLNLERLISLSRKFKIYKLVVFDKDCEVKYVSRGRFGRGGFLKANIKSVCQGKEDHYVIGLKQSYRRIGYRFGLAKNLKTGGAILLLVDATYLKEMFDKISFLHVLDNIAKYKDIELVRFEKFDQVIFEKYRNQNIAKKLIYSPVTEKNGEVIQTKVVSIGDTRFLLVSSNVFLDGEWQGCLRLGLSLSYLQLLDKGFLVLAFILFVLVVLMDAFYFYALNKSERLYRESSKFNSVLNQIEDGIVIRQLDGSVFQNDAVSRLIGDKKNSVLSMSDGVKTFDIKGKKIMVAKKTYPFGEVFIIRDVTIEEASKESKEREKKIFSMGKLASSFAHEVRNPLNTISMIIQQVAFSKKLSDSEKDMINIVKGEIERLNAIVNEFMEVSKTPELKFKNVLISSFLNDIVKFYQESIKNTSKEIKVSIKEDFSVQMDLAKFKGVIINLIQNAFEANASRVELEVSLADNFGILKVKDNGEGMTEDEAERAFDLYFTTKSKGSGLGLPYVQRIVSLHGGFVKLQSEKGRGATVEIFLPLKKGDE